MGARGQDAELNVRVVRS